MNSIIMTVFSGAGCVFLPGQLAGSVPSDGSLTASERALCRLTGLLQEGMVHPDSEALGITSSQTTPRILEPRGDALRELFNAFLTQSVQEELRPISRLSLYRGVSVLRAALERPRGSDVTQDLLIIGLSGFVPIRDLIHAYGHSGENVGAMEGYLSALFINNPQQFTTTVEKLASQPALARSLSNGKPQDISPRLDLKPSAIPDLFEPLELLKFAHQRLLRDDAASAVIDISLAQVTRCMAYEDCRSVFLRNLPLLRQEALALSILPRFQHLAYLSGRIYEDQVAALLSGPVHSLLDISGSDPHQAGLMQQVYRRVPGTIEEDEFLRQVVLGPLSVAAYKGKWTYDPEQVLAVNRSFAHDIEGGLLNATLASQTSWTPFIRSEEEPCPFVHTSSELWFAPERLSFPLPCREVSMPGVAHLVMRTRRGLDLEAYKKILPSNCQDGIGLSKEKEVAVPIAINPDEIVEGIYIRRDRAVRMIPRRSQSGLRVDVEVRDYFTGDLLETHAYKVANDLRNCVVIGSEN